MMTLSLNSLNFDSGRPFIGIERKVAEFSENHVKQLAKETENTVDGPFSSKQTGYEMKKTLAVILEELINRVDTLEKKINSISKATNDHDSLKDKDKEAVKTYVSPPLLQEKVDVKGLIMGAQEDCAIKEKDKPLYPNCEGKVKWMLDHWKSDACYAAYGVDGSSCSIRVYLSEIETWCPLLPGRSKKKLNTTETEQAVMNFDLQKLLAKLINPGTKPNYNWIRDRIKRMWPSWKLSGESLQKKVNSTSSKKKILLHLGLLSKKSGFKMAENSLRGGPLGELVQWSDVISSLYILGHDITITSEYEQLVEILNKLPTARDQCQSREKVPVDTIVTDLVGLSQFKKKVGKGYFKFKCLLWILDSFGTEPAYNDDVFAKARKLKTSWGMQNLDPRQFFTMFPHSPDNSFMGFVIENLLNHSSPESIVRKNQAVVYGKAEYMWQGKESYLEVFHQLMKIHGTVFREKNASVKSVVPSYVENHGILSGPEVHSLLRESKLFIGLGFPYEGPAPLEAIAQGNVFINPKFNPPHSSLNTKFFKGKPTSRGLTSQHPYAEVFIGEPHVKTIDIDDKEALKTAIQSALSDVDNGKVTGFIPYEFTQEGMLQRVSSFSQHLHFCKIQFNPWPPKEDIQFISSLPSQSCRDACLNKNLVCEGSYLQNINSKREIERIVGKSCAIETSIEDIYYPAFKEDTGQCILQKKQTLFSCVGEQNHLVRVCACRTYLKQQTALCQKCL